MHGDFDNTFDPAQKSLQLQQVQASQTKTEPTSGTHYNHESWVTAFNTSLLTTRANQSKDRSAELGELMQSAEFQSLLVAAQHLATTQGYSKEVATERLIDVFRKIDSAWKQLVMSRGMKTLIGE